RLEERAGTPVQEDDLAALAHDDARRDEVRQKQLLGNRTDSGVGSRSRSGHLLRAHRRHARALELRLELRHPLSAGVTALKELPFLVRDREEIVESRDALRCSEEQEPRRSERIAEEPEHSLLQIRFEVNQEISA